MKDHNKILEEYIKNGCKGDLDLSESNIESLPDNLEVGGYLDLRFCENLTSLPNNLKVGRDLNLGFCKKLTSIGDNIEVNGNLDLYSCRNLTSLPDNLKVNGELNLGRTEIKTLPPTLEVKGDIYLHKYFNLEAYVRETFIKTMEGKPVAIIGGEIITQ